MKGGKRRAHRAMPKPEWADAALQSFKDNPPPQIPIEEMIVYWINKAPQDIVLGKLFGINNQDDWDNLQETEKNSLIKKRVLDYCNGARPIGYITHIRLHCGTGKDNELRWWKVDENGKKEPGPGMLDPSAKLFKKEEEFKHLLNKLDRNRRFLVGASAARKKGLSARQSEAEKRAADIKAGAATLQAKGKPQKDIAGILAKEHGITPRRVRQILNE